MPRPIKQDPYCTFKDDRERRIALNVRSRCYAVAAVAIACTANDWHGSFRWLMTLFR